MPDVWIDDRRGDVGLALCNFGQVDLRNGGQNHTSDGCRARSAFSPQQRTVLEKIGSSALCPDAESCMQDRGVDGRIACSTGPGVILIRTFSSRNEVFEHGHPLFNIVADATVDGRLCVVIE